MRTFKVPDTLADAYHGAGRALTASVNGQLVALRYLADVLPEFDGSEASALALLDDARIAPAVRELQALGEVSVGMCSGWEFIEL